MTRSHWLPYLMLCLLGCGGGTSTTTTPRLDMQVTTVCTSDASCNVFTGTCETDSDCASSGSHCVYKIADACTAKGQCASVASGPTCGVLKQLCGCNGSIVKTGCLYPSGYATGPTTGANFCGDAGN